MNLGEGATLVAIARSAEEPSDNGVNGATDAANGNGHGDGEGNSAEPPPQ